MEARAAAVIAGLAEDPRWSVTSHSPLGVLGPVARVAVLRAKAPLRMLTAVVNPGLAPRAIGRIERRLRGSLTLPANASPAQRLDLVEDRLGQDMFLLMPTVFSYAATGLLLLRLARRLLGDLARPEELQVVLRGLPHNVTTEMDLELWQVATQIRGGSGCGPRPGRPAAGHGGPGVSGPDAAARRPAGHHRLPAPLRSPRRGRDRPRRAALVGGPEPHHRHDRQLPAADRSRAGPAGPVPPGTAGRGGDDHRTGRSGGSAQPAPGPADRLRAAPGPPADRAAGEPEVSADRGPEQRCATTCSRSAGRWSSRAASTAADDIFFLDYAEARRALDGERFADLVAERRAAYAVETAAAPCPAAADERRHRARGRGHRRPSDPMARWPAARPRPAR